MLVVLLAMLPPDIWPDGLITSPSKVTTLNEYLNFLEIAMAEFIFSTITVFPSKLWITASYFLSYSIRFAATPKTPSMPFKFSEILKGLTEESGKKEALPKLFTFKYSIALFASSSVCVTMFWIDAPKVISIAFSSLAGTLIKLATAPYTFFPNASSFWHLERTSFTALL